jgi:integrase
VTRTELTIAAGEPLSEVHYRAIESWAKTSTGPGPRFADLVRDKSRAVIDFFAHANKTPSQVVTPIDVQRWLEDLRNKGQSPSTIYSKASRLSAFYKWAITQGLIDCYNPVDPIRPKAPKAYSSESTQALADSDVKALLGVIRRRAKNDIIGKRDYAMLLFYLLTGMRRSEVCRLRWGDLTFSERAITIRVRVKGGERVNIELKEHAAREALLDYLRAGARLDAIADGDPLWIAFDFAKSMSGRSPGTMLTSHAFVHNLKRYAKEAGIGHIHLHQTRHTVAARVADADGIKAAQEQLGHKSEQTTRVYVQRVTVRRDKFSSMLAEAFGIDEDETES